MTLSHVCPMSPGGRQRVKLECLPQMPGEPGVFYTFEEWETGTWDFECPACQLLIAVNLDE